MIIWWHTLMTACCLFFWRCVLQFDSIVCLQCCVTWRDMPVMPKMFSCCSLFIVTYKRMITVSVMILAHTHKSDLISFDFQIKVRWEYFCTFMPVSIIFHSTHLNSATFMFIRADLDLINLHLSSQLVDLCKNISSAHYKLRQICECYSGCNLTTFPQ